MAVSHPYYLLKRDFTQPGALRRPWPEIQTEATKIIVSHRTLVDLRKRKSGADPFVIASAVVRRCTVVTEEKSSGGPGKVKIRYVCKAKKIEYINVVTMLSRGGMRLE